jgi:ankyrin repeat protein
LDHGANIAARDGLGRTLILKAVLGQEGHKFNSDIVMELLERDADVGAIDKNGQGLDRNKNEKFLGILIGRRGIKSLREREVGGW